jgi:hypothetical protein
MPGLRLTSTTIIEIIIAGLINFFNLLSKGKASFCMLEGG